MALNASVLIIQDLLGLQGGVGPIIAPVTTGELGAGAIVRGIGSGAERTGSQHRVTLTVDRGDGIGGAIAGTFAVWGAELPDVISGYPVGDAFRPVPAENSQSFQAYPTTSGAASPLVGQANLNTVIPFVTFSNYNTIVVKNGIPLAQGAGAGKYTTTNVGGFIRIVLGTNVAANDDYAVYFVVPVQLLADAAHAIERVGVFSRSVVWTNWAVDQLATNRTIVTLTPAVGA